LSNRRVVVTGLGALTPIGNTVEETWSAAIAGKSGIAPITHFDPVDIPVKIAGEVKNFDPSLSMDQKEIRRMAVFVCYGVEAARQAILDSGLTVDSSNAHRVGVAVGSGIGGLAEIVASYENLKQGGARKVSPFFIPGAIINMVAGMIAIKYGCKGPNVSVVTACATGAHNIGTSYRMIQNSEADVMVAGGAEMATTALGMAGFSAVRALSNRNDEPTLASRPWDRDRDGFVLGEGAGVMILEEYEHAKARGATIYAEISGYGMSDDGYHLTAPDPTGEGFVSCMQSAIKDSGLALSDIAYVNAHGTSTPMADPIEADAIAQVFTGYTNDLLVSSTKSMTGHMLGATGAVEAIFGVLAIRDNIAPPTINLDHPYEGCQLNLVPKVAQKKVIRAMLTNSFGFGGTNTSLVISELL
jgi:3-oxoacyl-[acyl-carrier-protein] synthase II